MQNPFFAPYSCQKPIVCKLLMLEILVQAARPYQNYDSDVHCSGDLLDEAVPVIISILGVADSEDFLTPGCPPLNENDVLHKPSFPALRF